MVDRIHIYVDSVHPVGGVTTWAYQVSTRLHRFDARVVTVSRTRDNTADAHLFPGPRIALYSGPNSKMHSAYANGQNDQSSQEVPFAETISCLTIPTKPTTPTLPTTPTQPTPSSGKRLSPRTKITKETKPTKPTLPTKPTILGHELVRSWDDLDEFVRQEVTKTSVFVPNYLEVGYRHAALSRVQGLPSRCIGMCHTDHPYYYDLLVRYQQIIHSFGAVSGRCKRKLCELIPHRGPDIYLLPYGVDIVGLKRVHLSADPVRILYSGRLVKEQKRIMDLVKVVDALDRRGCKFLFDFVGVGRDKEELIKAIEEMPKVRVLEGVSHPNMMELYQHYDILLLASETEGMSIAMLESMSRGVVPVVTRVSGSEEVIVDGRNGFLCEVGDVELMAQRIWELSRHRGLLVNMSRRALETVGRYSTEEHIKGFSKVISATLEKPLISQNDALRFLQNEGDRMKGNDVNHGAIGCDNTKLQIA